MGCSKTEQPTARGFTTNAGDFGPFLLQQVIQRGGHPNTNGLTPIPADWRYTSPNGLQTLIFVTVKGSVPAIGEFPKREGISPTL